MACSDPLATPEDFTKQWFYDFTESEEVELEPLLSNASSFVHAAMAAQGMCDCTLADWAEEYLRALTVMIAAVMFNAACVRLTEDQRGIYRDQVNEQLRQIREGELELCAGETAKTAPAFGIAPVATTPFTAAQIILNDIKRENA